MKIAERFGCLPWELADGPMDDYQELIEWLTLEAELEKQYPPKG